MTFPFVQVSFGTERIKMAALKTKDSVLLMKERVLYIDSLVQQSKNADGSVDVPRFTKAIFDMQDKFFSAENRPPGVGAEFYETIRNSPREKLLEYISIRPLFEIDKSNAALVLEATKKQLALMQDQADDEFEPHEECEYEPQLI